MTEEQTTKNTETEQKETQETNSEENISKEESKEQQESQTTENPDKDKDNIIFVGVKPFMNYVTGVVMQFKTKNQNEVIVSARGKFISKAVDVVEVARRTFLKEENIKIKDIKISSETFENKEGKRIHVSAIEITLVRE